METEKVKKPFFIDMHADILCDVIARRMKGEKSVLEKHHLEKMRKGGVNALILDIYVEPWYKPFRALARALKVADALYQDLGEGRDFTLVRTYRDIQEVFEKGKICVILGAEGGEFIEHDLSLLRIFHRLGMRVFGLVHEERNMIADGSSDCRSKGGLSEFGLKVVEELNRLGIVIDLAHLPPAGFWDVMENSSKPVIRSHGRLIDDQIKALAKNGGIFGVYAVNSGPLPGSLPTIKEFLDQIDHVVKLVGPDYVGIGADFIDFIQELVKLVYPDTEFHPVKGLANHSEMCNIPRGLKDRGYSDKDIRKILGENFLRVFREVVS